MEGLPQGGLFFCRYTEDMKQTIADIKQRLQEADEERYAVLARALEADTRKGVKDALAVARRRLDAEAAERDRVERLYRFDADNADGGILVGLDEVGRGPLAGPLTVGAVVLPTQPHILGINDSKQVSPEKREALSGEIRETALAWSIVHIEPERIDNEGMTACLRAAFAQAVDEIEAQGVAVDVVLLDGNPLHFDMRERNVIKGDARSASIGAASIIAKVERDGLMRDYAAEYPAYGFEKCKGYASAEHIAAIKEQGLCPIHRVSFCTHFTQETLF